MNRQRRQDNERVDVLPDVRIGDSVMIQFKVAVPEDYLGSQMGHGSPASAFAPKLFGRRSRAQIPQRVVVKKIQAVDAEHYIVYVTTAKSGPDSFIAIKSQDIESITRVQKSERPQRRGAAPIHVRHKPTHELTFRQQAELASVGEVTDVLKSTLTDSLTAYMAGASEVGVIESWAGSTAKHFPDNSVDQRLRTAYEAVLMLRGLDAPRTIRAWFTGREPRLGDQAPAQAIREGKLQDVLLAASAFSVNG
jgi:hypothetical protein